MNSEMTLQVKFWKSYSGNEPVLEWLKDQSNDDRQLIGQKIMTVQFRWPIGMPTVRKIEPGLWEVRIHLTGGKIAGVLFTIFESNMVLLHGFIKKSQKTPATDLEKGRQRK